jgi:hypothetical protein
MIGQPGHGDPGDERVAGTFEAKVLDDVAHLVEPIGVRAGPWSRRGVAEAGPAQRAVERLACRPHPSGMVTASMSQFPSHGCGPVLRDTTRRVMSSMIRTATGCHRPPRVPPVPLAGEPARADGSGEGLAGRLLGDPETGERVHQGGRPHRLPPGNHQFIQHGQQQRPGGALRHRCAAAAVRRRSPARTPRPSPRWSLAGPASLGVPGHPPPRCGRRSGDRRPAQSDCTDVCTRVQTRV